MGLINEERQESTAMKQSPISFGSAPKLNNNTRGSKDSEEKKKELIDKKQTHKVVVDSEDGSASYEEDDDFMDGEAESPEDVKRKAFKVDE